MARKQKKLTRKERQQQQQEAITHRRETKGWVPPQERGHQRQELAQDMEPILPLLADSAGNSDPEAFMMLLIDSADLAEEPEFEDILIDPFLAVSTYIQASENLGFSPDDLDKLPEEEQADKLMEMLEVTTRQVLTKELRQEILKALNQLRQRLKRTGHHQDKVAKAAALQSFLSERKSEKLWPMTGLTQSLVHRSVSAGFELFELSEQVMDEAEVNDDEPSGSLLQKMTQKVTGAVESVLKKTPGLGHFLENQADKIWDEGEAAIFEGDLYLELFTPDEIEAGLDMFEAAFGREPGDESTPRVTKKTGKGFIQQLDDLLTESLTPERLDQLRERLKTVIAEKDYPPKYTSFLLMLDTTLAEEDVDYNKRILIHAFIGEMRATTADVEESSDEED